ncbi:MAG TPA: hypothetical protein VMO47_01870 [Rhodothermales bacterium]|nr:hypothetical protein [Rhodothermales bacterium]
MKLVVKPGAVVKFATVFEQDTDGKLVRWEPPGSSGYLRARPGSSILIDGATLTDIRDDSVGGDTNEDGEDTKPTIEYRIYLWNSTDVIRESTIKYSEGVEIEGASPTIKNSMFIQFGGLRPDISIPYVESAPVIVDNTFELAYPTGRELDLRGMSPLFSRNVVKSVLAENHPSAPPGSNVNTRGMLIGPVEDPNDPSRATWAPRTGITTIEGNRFETTTGVDMNTSGISTSGYARIDYRAVIRDNVFRGTSNPATGSPGGRALILVMDANVEVSGNEISNHSGPFIAWATSGIKQSRLHINRNRFSLEGSNPGSSPINTGWDTHQILLDATNNFWGDPSGPYDPVQNDALFNPRGKGLWIGEGIDYVPFQGGAVDYTDGIGIEAGATRILGEFEDSEGQNLSDIAAGDEVEIEIVVDYIRLRSAERGLVVAYVRDQKGAVLYTSEPVSVTAEDTGVEIPPFSLTIPTNAANIDVDAELISETALEGKRSNTQRFALRRARSHFTSQAVDPVTKGSLEPAVQGATSSALFQVQYTLHSTGDGRLDFDFEERKRGTEVVMNRFDSYTLSIPPGTDLKAEQRIDAPFSIPAVPTKSEFFIRITMRDDTGAIVAEESAGVNVRSPGQVAFGNRLDEDEEEDDVPKVIPAPSAAGGNLSKSGRSYFKPGDDTQLISETAVDVEVRESAETETVTVPAEALKATFLSTGAELTFTSNTQGGRLTVDRFAMPFESLAKVGPTEIGKTSDYSAWQLIPINSHWTIYGDLEEGTYQARVALTYDPDRDFPSVAGFLEDSLMIAAYNPLSSELEVLPSVLDKASRTVSADYSAFFEAFVVASRNTVVVQTANETYSDLPETYALDQNYPNPFNPTTPLNSGCRPPAMFR